MDLGRTRLQNRQHLFRAHIAYHAYRVVLAFRAGQAESAWAVTCSADGDRETPQLVGLLTWHALKFL